jgi:hypothetical protein
MPVSRLALRSLYPRRSYIMHNAAEHRRIYDHAYSLEDLERDLADLDKLRAIGPSMKVSFRRRDHRARLS